MKQLTQILTAILISALFVSGCKKDEKNATFNCVNGNCINAGSNGTYSSISDCQSSCGGETSFTDPRDGQTYETVKIGDQTWFAENLRYSGSIQEVSGDANWAAIWNYGNLTRQPAWCYYNDDPANDAIYGKLYNWYAVNTGGLCPSGWHIPSDAEWTVLTDFLGGVGVAGGKMKATKTWYPPNTDATNSSGFSGLPGGFREYMDGNFDAVGYYGVWWTSTEDSTYTAWDRDLNSNDGKVDWYWRYKEEGYSCRCLMD